jgi:hypothetical protein
MSQKSEQPEHLGHVIMITAPLSFSLCRTLHEHRKGNPTGWKPNAVFAQSVENILSSIEDAKGRVTYGYPIIELKTISEGVAAALRQHWELPGNASIEDFLPLAKATCEAYTGCAVDCDAEDPGVAMDAGYGARSDEDMEEAMVDEGPSVRGKRVRFVPNALKDSVALGRSKEDLFCSNIMGTGSGTTSVEAALGLDEADAFSDSEVIAKANPILAEYVGDKKLSAESEAKLESCLAGVAGGTLETHPVDESTEDPEVEALQEGVSRLCHIIGAVAIGSSGTNDMVTKMLRGIATEAAREDSVFKPNTAPLFPTSAPKLFSAVAAPHAPDTYIYDACECGMLRNKKSKDCTKCPRCNKPWSIKQRYSSIISHFRKAFAATQLAKALTRHPSFSSNEDNASASDGTKKLRDFWDQGSSQAALDDEVLPGERFGDDPRNQLLFVFIDGMLTIAKNKGSDKLTVGYLGSFNPEQHIRCIPGVGVVCFVTSKMKNIDGLLEIMDDELRYLRMVSDKLEVEYC